ncbi:MAG: hypothetical protein AB7W59_15680 [Acidimicrobiia bacterium]
MADVTLGAYTAYLYRELISAREDADLYAREVAKRYQADEVLKHFTVPRFKVPKVDLTIPVLVSGARYRETLRFRAPFEAFLERLRAEFDEVVRRMDLGSGRPLPLNREADSSSLDLGKALYVELADQPTSATLDSTVTVSWSRMLSAAMDERRYGGLFRELDQRLGLTSTSTQRIVAYCRGELVVDRTELDSLLVSPETNTVKNGSSDTSVFTIRAELVEEGFFVRELQGADGTTSTVVEFE